MDIRSITQGYQQNQVQAPAEALTQESLNQLKQELQLATGQILSGRVTSMEGDQIMLLLDNKQTLSAQLTGEMPINVGQMLSFEVRSNNGQQTELRPLYTNLSHESTIGAALSEANLPMTDRNVSMVEHMMEEGMPVNKQALLEMVDSLHAHPDVNPSTIVQMQKLNLPLDEPTIRQFENYQNFEHEIENDVKNMNEGLVTLPEELIAQGNDEQAFAKAAQVMEMAMETSMETSPEAEEAVMTVQEGETLEIADQLTQLAGYLTEANGPEEAAKNDAVLLQAADVPEKQKEAVQEPKPVVMADTIQDATANPPGTNPQQNDNIPVAQHQQAQVKEEAPLSAKPEDASAVVSEQVPEQDKGSAMLKLTNQLLNAYQLNPDAFSKEDKELLKDALKNPLLKDALFEKLNAALQLRPADVAKEGKVEELYKRILEYSGKAMELLNDSSSTAAQAVKSAQNLSDNVQFMNQLNEMMAYVQLPLKMSEENAHGDLYVYANKKKLAQNDGNFSALLHLDMEHLGPMDVYVAMQKEKVSTHFYMRDEAMLDFIEANIHILNERLTKKGYQMNTTVSVKDDPKNTVIEEFLKQEKDGIVTPVLSTMSFDVRA